MFTTETSSLAAAAPRCTKPPAQPPLAHLGRVVNEADVLPVQVHGADAFRQYLAHGQRVLNLLDDEVRKDREDLELDAVRELVHAVEQPRIGEPKAVELGADA